MPASTAWALAALAIITCSYLIHIVLLHRIVEMWKIDGLTGLPVRYAFYPLARRALAERACNIVAFLDVDDFKPLNDDHSHRVGDAALAEVGHRLRRYCGETGVAGRLGGDEFVFVVPSTRAGAWENALPDLLSYDIDIDGHTFHVRTSIGVVQVNSVQPSLSKVLQLAERMMYEAKRARCGYRIYAASPNDPRLAGPVDRHPHHRLRDGARAVLSISPQRTHHLHD